MNFLFKLICALLDGLLIWVVSMTFENPISFIQSFLIAICGFCVVESAIISQKK